MSRDDIEISKKDIEMWQEIKGVLCKYCDCHKERDEIVELKDQRDNLQTSISEYKAKNSSLQDINSTLQKSIDKNPIIKLDNLYQRLSQPTQKAISNILSGDEMVLFANGVKNFGDIWEYAQELNSEHNDEDFKILLEIVEMLFDSISEVDTLQIQEIEIGDSFDSDKMSRDNRSSSQSGVVEQIVLFGYTKRGKLKQKSIVKVG